jgi:hypothetical protein
VEAGRVELLTSQVLNVIRKSECRLLSNLLVFSWGLHVQYSISLKNSVFRDSDIRHSGCRLLYLLMRCLQS